MNLNYFLNKVKDVNLCDIAAVFPMLAALIASPFTRHKYKNSWLVCEEPLEARDNGYHFFKYMCKKQPQQKCYYAIKKESVDYNKVAKYGNIIEYGSIQHWLAYFLCEYNVSSQKGGKPNAALCSFMELNHIFKPKNIFLQHGITKDHAEWLYADKTCFQYFITAAVPEDVMIRKDFGYSKGVVRLTGFPRYDALDSTVTKKKRVLIMPTWRNWFNLKSKGGEDVCKDFRHSDYLKKWLAFLNDEKLREIINANDLEVIFFLHRNMQRYIDAFDSVKSHITLASWKQYDIQMLLKTSALMITDYSSVFFDMLYMEKPILFYQFDEVEYRKYQYQEGWFDYHNNPFSESYQDKIQLIEKLTAYVQNGFCVDDEYKKGCRQLFKYLDTNNCERVYKLLYNQKDL